LKFKHTIVGTSFTLPPEPARLRRSGTVTVNVTATPGVPSGDVMPVAPSPAPLPMAPEAAPPVEVFNAERPEVLSSAAAKTTLMRWTDTRAIVPVNEIRSASYVLEEVELPVDVDPRLVMLWDHASAQARAFRLLRHRLLSQGDPRVLVVTSAEAGEGKTTCAANLALALADETMSRVLLVEGNLRRPALADLFGFEPADSFVRRLVDQRDASPPYAVAGVRGTRLHVAALPMTRPREARFDRLLLGVTLQELRSAYDYVVIDAAAVLESADVNVAGECADGVILVARAEMSHKSALEQAKLALHPARLAGVVVLDT